VHANCGNPVSRFGLQATPPFFTFFAHLPVSPPEPTFLTVHGTPPSLFSFFFSHTLDFLFFLWGLTLVFAQPMRRFHPFLPECTPPIAVIFFRARRRYRSSPSLIIPIPLIFATSGALNPPLVSLTCGLRCSDLFLESVPLFAVSPPNVRDLLSSLLCLSFEPFFSFLCCVLVLLKYALLFGPFFGYPPILMFCFFCCLDAFPVSFFPVR